MKSLSRHIIVALILISYLGVFSANVYHFHNYNFLINSLPEFGLERKNSNFQHSLEDCLVNSIFNSIHTAYFNFAKLDFNHLHSENYFFPLDSEKKQSFHLITKKLRAPPDFHS